MQRPTRTGDTEPTSLKPTLFLLHALGMSGAEWAEVGAHLNDHVDVVPLDLPGFGDRAATGLTCREMADDVAARIAATGASSWMIAGHSMGGRIAMIVAGMAEGGMPGLNGLTHVILVASSTLTPEPMDEETRAEMLGWVAGGCGIGPQDAATFVSANTADGLSSKAHETALTDLARTAPLAWRHWLERGSREDWSATVPPLHTPAVILAGAEDGPLGEATQRDLNAPRFADARVRVIDGAAHLIPLERPEALVGAIQTFVDVERPPGKAPRAIAGLLTGPRVSARTRAAHLARLADQEMPEELGAYGAGLAHLAEAILPGHAETVPDLPARVAQQIASGDGDGWRFADLPSDEGAFATGFAALDALAGPEAGRFADLPPSNRDALLHRIAAGEGETGHMPGPTLDRWVEDMRARFVRAWMAHPATMARIGYDGFANGGDGPRPQGYLLTAADRTEPWQPAWKDDA